MLIFRERFNGSLNAIISTAIDFVTMHHLQFFVGISMFRTRLKISILKASINTFTEEENE